MDRNQQKAIEKDLQKKIVLLSGPRQVGKTTLARMLFPEGEQEYLNYDYPEHRLLLQQRSWDRRKKIVIFDELHTMKKWKAWLKGIYDVEGLRPALLVTGSSRLDTARKTGDSLAGRFFLHRLHPLDVKEAKPLFPSGQALERLLAVGGFPEPFLSGDPVFYKRWRRSHLDVILRQDLVDLEAVRNIHALETLLELLRGRVGSPIAHTHLAGDLQCDHKTVKHWLLILQNLCAVFAVTPFSRSVARSLLKAPKYYFFDCAEVLGDEGARLENAVACALHKESQLLQDSLGEDIGLHYLRTRDGREVDFALVRNRQVRLLVEVKWSDAQPSRHLLFFQKMFPRARAVQLVHRLDRERSYPGGLWLRRAADWLAEMDLRELLD